jgi:hypothetical protein
MNQKIRQAFFHVFAIFFVIMAPVLTIYSLGYDLDLSNQSLTNTLSITIETIPRQVKIYHQDKLVGTRVGEYKAAENQLINLKLEAKDYHTESFQLWARPNQNTTARITNMWFLPHKADVLTKDDNLGFISILSDNLVMLKSQGQYYLQLYSFGGLQGNKMLIENSQNMDIRPGKWELLLEDTFWSKSQRLLIFKVGNKWFAHNLDLLPFQVQSVVRAKEDNLMLLTNKGELWLQNLSTGQLVFIDQGLTQLTYTNLPDTIWLVKNDTLYAVDRSQADQNLLLDSSKIYTENSLLAEFQPNPNPDTKNLSFGQKLKVKTLFQGIGVLIGEDLYYIQDFDKNTWQQLSTGVITFGTDSNTVFWLDNQSRLYVYNLQLKSHHEFGKIDIQGDLKEVTINYYFPWRRLQVYSGGQVFSVWYDKDILNDAIVAYNYTKLAEELDCRTAIKDRYQFCIRQHELIAYKNTSIW